MSQNTILIHYLGFKKTDGLAKISESMHLYRNRISKKEWAGITNFILPIYGGDSRIECVNPQLVSEQEYVSTLKVVNEAKEKLDDFLNQFKNGKDTSEV